MIARRTPLARAAGWLLLSGCVDRTEVDHVVCEDGVCVCVEGYQDCDPDPGCESFRTSDPDNCGECGRVCASGVCDDGVCRCDDEEVDCDGDPSNGCEVTPATDGANCGQCGHDCLGGACEDGRCRPVTLAEGFSAGSTLALTESRIFVSSNVGIESMRHDGSDRRLLAEALGNTCCDVAADADQVFFADDTSLHVIDLATEDRRLLHEGRLWHLGLTEQHVYAGIENGDDEGIARWDRQTGVLEPVDLYGYKTSMLQRRGNAVYWKDGDDRVIRGTAEGFAPAANVGAYFTIFAVGDAITVCANDRVRRFDHETMSEVASGSTEDCGSFSYSWGDLTFFYTQSAIRVWTGSGEASVYVEGEDFKSVEEHLMATDGASLYFLTRSELMRVRLPPSP